jgi:hypothetical protein
MANAKNEGTMAIDDIVLKITADVSAVEARLKKVESQIDNVQNKASKAGSGAFGNMNGALDKINSGLLTGIRQTGTFLGVAWGLHGAFHAIAKVVSTWGDLMKAGLSAVDEFRMGIVTSSGMLTALSKVPAPELGKAYDAWKEYHAWLYQASLEADRKVAASGQDIFEAGKELAIRGLVPKNKDQVYITGMLVDWIRSVTKGLSQQQQLWQEVRALFDGQMRLGAQALQQFVKVDPQFQEKFDAARKSAMAIGDAQPVWDLLKKTMSGMTFASKDMEQTLNSLQNTAKSAATYGLIQSFSEAYDSLVKYGWQVLDVFYQNGQLTAQGEEVANQLKTAWDNVKPSVDQLVSSIINGGPAMAARIGMVASGLGQIVVMAGKATAAILEMVAAIGAIDLGTLAQAAAIVGAGTLAGGALGALVSGGNPAAIGIGARVGGMAASAYAGYHAIQQGKENLAGEAIKGMAERSGNTAADIEEAASKIKRAATNTEKESLFAPVASKREQLDYATKVAGDYATTLGNEARRLKDSGVKGQELRDKMSEFHTKQSGEFKGESVDRGLRSGTYIDFAKSMYGVSEKAPKTPDIGMSQGKDKKGGGGGGGGAERKPIDYQLWLQEAKAKRDLAIAIAEQHLNDVKKKNDEEEKDLKRKLEQGLLSYQEYYAKLNEMNEAEAKAARAVYAEELKAVEEAHDTSVMAIKRKAEVREYTPGEMETAINIENLKYQKEKLKIEGKIKDLTLDTAAKKKQYEFDSLEALRKQQIMLKELELGLAWGPLEERKASVEKVRQEYANRRKGFAEGTEESNRLKALEDMAVFQAKFKDTIDGFVSAITGGIDGIVDALMEGGEGLLSATEDMFKSLFKEAMKPGVEWLQQQLTNLFKWLFSETGLGAGLGGAMMGAIGLVGMMVTKSLGTKSTFTASGVTSNVTTHENVRGVIAGESSVAIGEISASLSDAWANSESYLREIAINTRNLAYASSGKDLSQYFNESLAKGA